MTRLGEHATFVRAVELLRREMRTSIVHLITAVPRVVLRDLHREIHGRSPKSGQLPSSAALLSTRWRQVHAATVVGFYEAYGGRAVRQGGDTDALIAAYDSYLGVVRGQGNRPALDLNDAWVLSRDLRVGLVEVRVCGRCQIRYLVAQDSHLPPTCPLCALRRRSERRADRERSRCAAAPAAR